MHFSDLQRFIVKQTYKNGPRCARESFEKFYSRKSRSELDAITRSLERLIAKGYLVAYGHKTAEKFFIKSVSATARGRKAARELLLRDQRLPLR